MTAPVPSITIRPQRDSDAESIERLAQLEGTAIPEGRLLVAEVAGEPWAALSVDTGESVADPFRPSQPVVDLMRRHASSGGQPEPGATRIGPGRLRELVGGRSGGRRADLPAVPGVKPR